MGNLSQLILASCHFLLVFIFSLPLPLAFLGPGDDSAGKGRHLLPSLTTWVWLPVPTRGKDRTNVLRLSSDLCMPTVAFICPHISTKEISVTIKDFKKTVEVRAKREGVFCKHEVPSLGLQLRCKSWAWLAGAVIPSLTGGDRWAQEHAGHLPFFPLASKPINIEKTLRNLKSVLKASLSSEFCERGQIFSCSRLLPDLWHLI